MKVELSQDKKYRPTYKQWKKIVEETEIDPYCHHSVIELINFKTSHIHLKGGVRLAFDCLSEATYLQVVNGGHYETEIS